MNCKNIKGEIPLCRINLSRNLGMNLMRHFFYGFTEILANAVPFALRNKTNIHMEKRTIIIFGSSDSYGKTRQLVDELRKGTDWDFVDLNTKTIGYFDYEFKNQTDDFIPLMRNIVDNYDLIIFATPVYWYTMSGIMKVFFDRISDLLKVQKSIGRKLRAMEMAVVCSGADTTLVDGFYMPFRESAKYLGMNYIGDYYGNLEENSIADLQENIDTFRNQILTS